MGEKCLFQNKVNFAIEVDSKNRAKNAQTKWYDNCDVVRLLRQIEYWQFASASQSTLFVSAALVQDFPGLDMHEFAQVMCSGFTMQSFSSC